MQDFGTKADDTAGPSGQLSAAEFNNLATELENSVLRSGQALSGASTDQLATSLFLHGVASETFQDSGVANAYVATPVSGASGVLLPSSYANLNGAVINFKAAFSNSGASTLNIGQTTGTLLGTKKILSENGLALSASAITTGQYLQLRYDSALDAGAGAWVMLRWSSSEFSKHGMVVLSAVGVSSWTVPDGVTRVKVTVTGGGGGSGGIGVTNATTVGVSGGGGAGGTAIRIVDLTGISSVSVTIGAGGAAGIAGNTSGGNGGASSFGAFASASGGGFSTGVTISGGNASSLGGSGGGATGGDLNLQGGDGTSAIAIGGELAPVNHGNGGASYWGGGARNSASSLLYGTGGGPRASVISSAATAGIAGTSGVVVVEW